MTFPVLKSIVAGGFMTLAAPLAADPLASWADTDNRAAITKFVVSVTTEGSPSFLEASDRIAVFDNDGTLWTEKPTYTEVIFALSQVKALAPNHPEWATTEPFSLILDKGLGALKDIGLKGAITALTAVYAELGDDAFAAAAKDFLDDPHLTAERTYSAATYAPVVELLSYLQQNDFEVFIVSGGTNDFMRTFAKDIYNVPTQNIIGTALKTEVVVSDTGVELKQHPEFAFFNDGKTKVLSIDRVIGRRPTIVVGNSNGDLPMMQYALGGDGPRLAMLVHHDDDAREAAYDKGAEDAIKAAMPEGDNMLLVSMKSDFATLWSK